jgi:hypothetical protein
MWRVRVAAMIVAAVLCADLAGLDCAHLALQPPASAHGSDSTTDAEAPDCLCCSVAEAAGAPVLSITLRAGATSEMPVTAVADGVLPLPYRPPVSLPHRLR